MDDAELARIRQHWADVRLRPEASGVQRSAAETAPGAQQAGPEPVRPVFHPAVQAGWLTGMIERDG